MHRSRRPPLPAREQGRQTRQGKRELTDVGYCRCRLIRQALVVHRLQRRFASLRPCKSLRTRRQRFPTPRRPAGSLVHALVLNAAKRAFGPSGGQIVIRLSQTGTRTCCSVRASGLALAASIPGACGIGISLARLRAMRAGAFGTWHVHHDDTETFISVDVAVPARAGAPMA